MSFRTVSLWPELYTHSETEREPWTQTLKKRIALPLIIPAECELPYVLDKLGDLVRVLAISGLEFIHL